MEEGIRSCDERIAFQLVKGSECVPAGHWHKYLQHFALSTRVIHTEKLFQQPTLDGQSESCPINNLRFHPSFASRMNAEQLLRPSCSGNDDSFQI
jgi:hypothetical protein